MVYTLIDPMSTPPYLHAVPTSGIPDSLGTRPTPPFASSFSTELRNALDDLKQTLHPLETSSTSSHKRLQLNTLTLQLNTLDALLKTAIDLLQHTVGNASRNGNHRYLPSALLPDTSLEDIRSLFIEITQTLQHVEIDR